MQQAKLGHGEDTPCEHCGHPLFVGDRVYSVDGVLWGCSQSCAKAAEQKAQLQYEERLRRGISCYGLDLYCQMNPLLRDDIVRVGRNTR